MGQGWYYKRDGVERGPVPAAELKRLAAAGKLGPADVVRREDMEKWLPAGQVKGLFAAPLAATATPPDSKPARPVAARSLPRPRPKHDEDEEPQPAGPGEDRHAARRKLGTPAVVGIAAGGVLLLGLVVTGTVLLLGGKKSGDQSVDAAKGGGGQGDGAAAVERSWSEYKTLDWKQKMSPDGLAVLPDGKTLAVCGKAVLLVDLDTGAETELEPPAKDSTTYYHIAAAPSGSLLAWYKYKSLDRVDETCGTRLWDSAQKRLHGRVVHTALNALGRPYSPTTYQYFSANGKTLVTSPGGISRGKVSKDSTKVWDADTLKLRADVPGYGGRTQISADGKVLALHGPGFASVILWDVETGREKTAITVPRKDEQSVPGFVLHPDGKRLLTASTKGVLLWDAATGQVIREVADYGERRFRYLQFVFSPDGKKLAAIAQAVAGEAVAGTTAVSSVKVWDLDSWAVATLRGKGTSSIKEFAFSPKGDLLVMAQYDKTLTVFNEEPGRGGKVVYREKDDEFVGASVESSTEKFDRGSATREEFVTRMRSDLKQNGWGEIMAKANNAEGHHTLANFEYDVFMATFGQPDAGYKSPDQTVGGRPVYSTNAIQSWIYRCKDGRVMMTVELVHPRLIVRELRLME